VKRREGLEEPGSGRGGKQGSLCVIQTESTTMKRCQKQKHKAVIGITQESGDTRPEVRLHGEVSQPPGCHRPAEKGHASGMKASKSGAWTPRGTQTQC
jgi:hypothetical protein